MWKTLNHDKNLQGIHREEGQSYLRYMQCIQKGFQHKLGINIHTLNTNLSLNHQKTHPSIHKQVEEFYYRNTLCIQQDLLHKFHISKSILCIFLRFDDQSIPQDMYNEEDLCEFHYSQYSQKVNLRNHCTKRSIIHIKNL